MGEARKKTRSPADEPARAKRGSRPAIVLLLAAAVVVGGTVYVAVRPPWQDEGDLVESPGPSQAQQTRRVIEEMIVRADRINATGNPGLQAAKRQAYETARDVAVKFIQLADRTDVVVRPMLAKAQLRLGKLAEAERTVDALLALAPTSGQGLWMKAQLVATRDRDRAVEYFRRAADSGEATAEAWARYGAELLQRGQVAEARKYLTRAERAGHRDPQTLLSLAGIAMEDENFARAETLLAEVVRRGHVNARVLAGLAEAQKGLGHLAEAEKTLRKAIDVEPVGELWMRLGDVLVLLRRRPEAAEAFARAAETPALAPAGAFKAARMYYLADRCALAMKYIDLLPAKGAAPAVEELRKKIENARFGSPTATSGPVFRLPRSDSLPERRAPAPSATRPAGWLP